MSHRTSRIVVVSAAALLASILRGTPAAAIPEFAHEYGMSCVKCHSVVPQLNAFGQAFSDNGFRIPKAGAAHVFPVSVRFNFSYSAKPDPDGLPKAIVDELELLSAGTIDQRVSYFLEQYVVDGGVPGATRDAWLSFWLSGDGRASTPVAIQAGQFTLPLPVDPETFRDSAQHYAVFDQTVGANPFDFFEPKAGVELRIGRAHHGVSGTYAALFGHDQQSELPTDGRDSMVSLQDATGPVTMSSYSYSGTRPLGTVPDSFRRQGFGISLVCGRTTLENVLQTGFDSSAFGTGKGVSSSGGFSQLRYTFSVAEYAIVRLDGTSDTNGFSRSTTLLFGRRIARNTRFTVEDVVTHAPMTEHALTTQFTVAF